MLLLTVTLLSPIAQATPCGPNYTVATVTELTEVFETKDGALREWEDGGLLPAKVDIDLPEAGERQASIEAVGWIHRLTNGLFQFDLSFGKVAGGLSLDWGQKTETGREQYNAHAGASADVAEVAVRYGRPAEHVEVAVNAGVGFNWGARWSDVNKNGIPEVRMTRRLPGSPIRVAYRYEDIEQVMSRERYWEIEREAAQWADEKHGRFWPSQAKADYYQAIKQSLIEREARLVQSQAE